MSTPSHSVHSLTERAASRWDAPIRRVSRIGASAAYATPSPSQTDAHHTVDDDVYDGEDVVHAGKRGRAEIEGASRRSRARLDESVIPSSASSMDASDEADEDVSSRGPNARKRSNSVAARSAARPAPASRKYSNASSASTSSSNVAPRETVARRAEGNRERWQAARVISFTMDGDLTVTPQPSLVSAFRFVYDACAMASPKRKAAVSESAQCSQMYSVLLRARGPGASNAHPAPTGVTYNHPLPAGIVAGSRGVVHFMVQLATEPAPGDVPSAYALWCKNGDKQRESGHPPPHARPARLIAFSRGGYFDMTEYACLTDTTRALHAATGRRREWRKLHNRVNNVLWTLGGIGGKTYQHPLTPPSTARDVLHFMVQYVSDEAPYDATSAADLWERSADMQRYDAFSSSQKAAMERVAEEGPGGIEEHDESAPLELAGVDAIAVAAE